MIHDLQFWQTVADMLSSVLAGTAIVLSVWIYHKIRKDSTYQNFDEMYMELLKISIDNPDFRNSSITQNYKTDFTGNNVIRYEAYAFMCWNLCETIFDRGDKDLMATWYCVIDTENSLHRNWFDAVENHSKFKDNFRAFVMKEFRGEIQSS